jgi:Phage integrase family
VPVKRHQVRFPIGHDLRHEGACRFLADGVDIRHIQLVLGHASLQQTQRYLNVTDEELGERTSAELEQAHPQACGIQLTPHCPGFTPVSLKKWRARQDSNLRPSAPEADALSS